MRDNQLAFTIPASEWLTSNGRYHHMTKAQHTALLRHRAHTQTIKAIRTRQLTPYTVLPLLVIEIGYSSRRKADPPNAYPTIKALIDGMTDAGLWPDDNSDIIKQYLFTRHDQKAPKGTHQIIFTFIDQEIPF